MASQRLKRSMRGAFAATAVAAALGISSVPASADPPPPANASDALKRFHEASKQAQAVTEEYKKAQDDEAAKRGEHHRLIGEAGRSEQIANQARAEEEKFRGKVDELASASYQGARLNKLSALVVSETPTDYLDRASALDVLARDNNKALQSFTTAKRQAESAEHQVKTARDGAAKAEEDAKRLVAEIGTKKADAEKEVRKAEQLKEQLSDEDESSLKDVGEIVGAIADTGQAAKAVNAALSKQGSSYVWGAKGPSTFDCSGLMYWAYKQAGVTIGGSTSTQGSEGRAVSASELKPGDLVMYSGHVSMYIGGGKAVHAPTSGDVVKVDDYKEISSPTGYRRIVG